ncbi:uncharacterized protein [Dermacentor albipictus]|uniref:uncharacterized protein n=1 Tax=Dermacentor albipictus TaxID=60249 RepID=UPI0038FC3CA1
MTGRLKRIFDRVQSKMVHNRTSYIVIGVRSSSCPGPVCKFDKNVQRIMNIFKPSLYVDVSHVLFNDWQARPCYILPQTILEFPGTVNRSYTIEQLSLVRAVACSVGKESPCCRRCHQLHYGPMYSNPQICTEYPRVSVVQPYTFRGRWHSGRPAVATWPRTLT